MWVKTVICLTWIYWNFISEKCAKYEKDKSYSVELAQKAAKGDGQAHDVSDSYDPYVHRKVSHPLT